MPLYCILSRKLSSTTKFSTAAYLNENLPLVITSVMEVERRSDALIGRA